MFCELRISIAHLVGRPSPKTETRALNDGLPLLAELGMFVGHVCGGPPPLTSYAEELRVLEAITVLRRMAGLTDARTGGDEGAAGR